MVGSTHTLSLEERDDGFDAVIPVRGAFDAVETWRADPETTHKRWRGAMVFGLIGAVALAVTVSDPCIWTSHRESSRALCEALPYWDQLFSGNLVPPLLFLGIGAMVAGPAGAASLFPRPENLHLQISGEQVRVTQRGRVAFQAARADTKLVVEGSVLVLIRLSDQHMVEWRTRCSDIALGRLTAALGSQG